MYGAIARLRIKPAMEDRFAELEREFEARQVPGFVAECVYRMDATPNEYYMTVVFESKEAYLANANDPDQDVFYRKFRELLEDDPEWHDGEIIYTYGL